MTPGLRPSFTFTPSHSRQSGRGRGAEMMLASWRSHRGLFLKHQANTAAVVHQCEWHPARWCSAALLWPSAAALSPWNFCRMMSYSDVAFRERALVIFQIGPSVIFPWAHTSCLGSVIGSWTRKSAVTSAVPSAPSWLVTEAAVPTGTLQCAQQNRFGSLWDCWRGNFPPDCTHSQ